MSWYRPRRRARPPLRPRYVKRGQHRGIGVDHHSAPDPEALLFAHLVRLHYHERRQYDLVDLRGDCGGNRLRLQDFCNRLLHVQGCDLLVVRRRGPEDQPGEQYQHPAKCGESQRGGPLAQGPPKPSPHRRPWSGRIGRRSCGLGVWVGNVRWHRSSVPGLSSTIIYTTGARAWSTAQRSDRRGSCSNLTQPSGKSVKD